MFLGLWGRFLVVSLGGLVVIAAIVIVTCFVGPGCWGFECLLQMEKKKKEWEGVAEEGKIGAKGEKILGIHLGRDFWTNAKQDCVIYQTGPRGFEKKVSDTDKGQIYQSEGKSFNLNFSPLLTGRDLHPRVENSFPRLKIKIFYSPSKTNRVMGRFAIHVISASSLPCREYLSTLDPCILLEIANSKWPFQKNSQIVHAAQTKVIKNNTNPIFDQTFIFDGTKREIKNWCLKFTVSDDDQLTKLTPILGKTIFVKDLKDLTIGGSISLNLEMEEFEKNMGNLLCGIRYLPTAQRFNVDVIKASKLKYQSHVSSLPEFYPYVRIVMLDNRGRCIKKKKTCVKQGEFNPTFNQSFIFDLSIANLEQTVFLILLCTRVANHLSKKVDDSFREGNAFDSCSFGKGEKEKVLGTIVLGRNVKCKKARNHWVTVMQNPRKTIEVWHDLR